MGLPKCVKWADLGFRDLVIYTSLVMYLVLAITIGILAQRDKYKKGSSPYDDFMVNVTLSSFSGIIYKDRVIFGKNLTTMDPKDRPQILTESSFIQSTTVNLAVVTLMSLASGSVGYLVGYISYTYFGLLFFQLYLRLTSTNIYYIKETISATSSIQLCMIVASPLLLIMIGGSIRSLSQSKKQPMMFTITSLAIISSGLIINVIIANTLTSIMMISRLMKDFNITIDDLLLILTEDEIKEANYYALNLLFFIPILLFFMFIRGDFLSLVRNALEPSEEIHAENGVDESMIEISELGIRDLRVTRDSKLDTSIRSSDDVLSDQD